MAINPDTIPRYAPPTQAELEEMFEGYERGCSRCAYYREVSQVQQANGLTHVVGACVLEIFQADTLKELARAELVEVWPNSAPCHDYRRDK